MKAEKLISVTLPEDQWVALCACGSSGRVILDPNTPTLIRIFTQQIWASMCPDIEIDSIQATIRIAECLNHPAYTPDVVAELKKQLFELEKQRD